MSVSINIENVVKKFGKDTIIDNLSLFIKPGEFFTLLGPSGCGKTTLLRMIIGFNSIEDGFIKIDDKIINDIPPDKRNMGMVFQNYAIFPHMSVKENVAFGLKMRKVNSQEIEKQVTDILKVVKIDQLAERMPTQLSGGQQQRVALARAIVIHPEVLLMDEPLSNLDAKLRVEMRNAIKHIQKRINITTVYVTHDQEEALAVSDRIAVMNNGKIQQIGSPKKIYKRPANMFVSSFIGLSNIFKATIKNKFLVFENDYKIKLSNLSADVIENQAVFVSVRPEEFYMNKTGEGIDAKVKNSVFLGLNTHYFLELPNKEEIEVIYEGHEAFFDNEHVKLTVKNEKINVFDSESHNTLIIGDDYE